MCWKLFTWFILPILVLLPLTTHAAAFRNSSQSLTIGANETINGDLYTNSGTVTIDGTINGDLIVAGGQVVVNGPIKGDVMAVAGQINIKGPVSDDIRVAGGTVTLQNNVGDDVLVAGGTTDITRDAVVSGDVLISSGQTTIAGTVGPVKASVSMLTLTDSARINGDLLYISSSNASIASGAIITGKITHRTPPVSTTGVAAFLATARLISLLMTFVFLLLFIYLFPGKSEKVANSWHNRFGFNLLTGFIFLIIVPVAIFILMATVVGIPLGIGAMLLYPILLYLGMLAGIIALGKFIQQSLYRGNAIDITWLTALLGLLAYTILRLIPIIGWLATLLVFLTGVGALIRYYWDIILKLRANKTL